MNNADVERLWSLVELTGVDRDDVEMSLYAVGNAPSEKPAGVRLVYTPNGTKVEYADYRNPTTNLFVAICYLIANLIEQGIIGD